MIVLVKHGDHERNGRLTGGVPEVVEIRRQPEREQAQ